MILSLVSGQILFLREAMNKNGHYFDFLNGNFHLSQIEFEASYQKWPLLGHCEVQTFHLLSIIIPLPLGNV